MGNFKRGALLAIAGSLVLTACGSGPDDVGAPAIQLTLSASSITVGQSANLQWSAQNAFSCAASGDWTGPRDVLGGQSTGTITQPGTYTYSLSCSGPQGTQTATSVLTVVPGPGPSVWLTAQPQAVVQGQSVKLTWTSTNVTSCTASGSWAGARSTSGVANTGTLATAGSFNYVLTCVGTNGQTATDTETVLVGEVAAPTVSLNLSSSSIFAGQSALLNWSSSNATTCTTIGSWKNPGTRQISSGNTPESTGALAAGSYSYSLVCSGPGGTTTSSPQGLQVSNPPATPTTAFSVNPSTVGPNAPATLTWSSTGVTGECDAGISWSGKKPSSGTAIVSHGAIGSYIYELTCPGVAKKSVTLNVVNTTPPVFTTALTASPKTVNSGQPITLNWAANNNASCTASGSWTGARSAGGSEVIFTSTPGIMSFALTCTNAGGSVVSTETVTVQAGGTSPVISFNCAEPNSYVIAENTTTNLCWSVSPNVETVSCTAFGDWAGAKARNGTQQIGPFSIPGTYNYALQCVNSATGQTTLGQQQVTVTPLSNAKPRVTIYASPLVVPFNGTTLLDWTASNDADSCVASGSWSGNKSIIGNEPKGPFPMPGVLNYVLTCSNEAGQARSGVIVDAKGPVASVNIDAVPGQILPGGQSTLSWSSQGVTNCTATGDWSGTQTTSGSASTGVLSSIRTYVYRLACTGPGGEDDDIATVTVTTPAAPTLELTTDTPVINPGEKARLRWNSTNADSCVASGSWSGSPGTNSNGYTVNETPSAVGSYNFSLTCSNAGGSVSRSATVQVVVPCTFLNSVPLNVRNKALLDPNVVVEFGTDAVLCVNCNVANPGNVATADQNDHATINLPVGLIGAGQITVTDSTAVYSGGMPVGFVVSVPSELLSVDLLKDLSLTTYLDGAPQETFQNPELLNLDLLALLGNPNAFFVNATTTKPFDGVRITKSSLLSVFPQTRVYGACVVIPDGAGQQGPDV